MSRDVLYDSDRLTVGKFYLFGKVECRERFSKILSLNVFIAYIIWCLVKYRMIKIEKYQIYEDECFDELLMRFFNFFMVRLQTFVLNI